MPPATTAVLAPVADFVTVAEAPVALAVVPVLAGVADLVLEVAGFFAGVAGVVVGVCAAESVAARARNRAIRFIASGYNSEKGFNGSVSVSAQPKVKQIAAPPRAPP
jgi:hypothetical protein